MSYYYLVDDCKRFLANKIYNKYQDSIQEVKIPYENWYTTHIKTYLLKNVPSNDVGYLFINNIVSLKELLDSPKDFNIFNSYLFKAKLDTNAAFSFFKNHFYINEQDEKDLRQIALSTARYCEDIINDMQIIQENNITSDELQQCLDNILIDDQYTLPACNKYFDILTNKQKDNIIMILYSNQDLTISFLVSELIPLDFKERIINDVVDLNKIAHTVWDKLLGVCGPNNTIIRKYMFNYLIKNTDIDFCYYYDNNKLDKSERETIYNKYKNIIFDNIVNTYRAYYDMCINFGECLNDEHQKLLIKKLRTKSRQKDIPRAKRCINFSEENLTKLNAIELTYEL